MLYTLHRIVNDVNSAPDLGAALSLIVREVKQAVGAHVCSVYLTDFDARSHVLAATEGLRQEAVGKVTLPLGRGLIGLVTERAEPLNLADAPNHPRYMHVAETGETKFRGFLGVPIIQNRKVLGVLVVRQKEVREFSDDEVTFLFTLAAQLAGAITHARASGQLTELGSTDERLNRFLEGRSSAAGVVMGTARVAYRLADLDAVPDRPVDDVAAEEAKFRAAVAAVEQDLRRLKEQLADALPPEDHALFDALLLMLASDVLVEHTIERIHGGVWAPGALRQTIAAHAAVFDAMEDVYLRERASDVRDLGRRILMHLQSEAAAPLVYPERTILVGDEVSAVQLAEVPRDRLAGVVSATGSSSSHVAILARGMGIAAVMGVTDLPVGGLEGHELIVDGYRGRVYVSPPPAVVDEYQRLVEEERELSAELDVLRGQPAETSDGIRVPLLLNTGLVNEVGNHAIGEAEGVGLYRTEVPFMVRDRFPGESVQTANYERVLEAFVPRPVILRTLDIGGDKPLPYFPMSESNPFLGWRGVRVSLDHPEIFLTQVRAMLRAAAVHGNLQIMLPMISSVSEVDELLLLIQQAHDELLDEGYVVDPPPVGVMVEVPSAVYQVEELARRVDFLSIGTNDLTQYLLAVDRNNPSVAGIYDDLHPAVLRAVNQVVLGAHNHGKPVSVCGELAGNTLATPLLLGMGVDSLSMSAGSLLKVKWVIRSISKARARQWLKAALRMESAGEIRRFMEANLDKLGLGGLYRPGR
jgi:phosphotransferase system enzyme I (PtsP)